MAVTCRYFIFILFAGCLNNSICSLCAEGLFLKRVLEHLNGIRSLKHLVHFLFRWLINEPFSERSPVNPQSSQRPIHGSRHTKGASWEADQIPKFGKPTQRISDMSAVRWRTRPWQDLVVKYQRIMVKHMVINLTGTILQFESGFFICLGCAGLDPEEGR